MPPSLKSVLTEEVSSLSDVLRNDGPTRQTCACWRHWNLHSQLSTSCNEH